MVRRGMLAVGLAVLALWPAAAVAQQNFWLYPFSGSFGDTGNWSLGTPMPGHAAVFDLHSPGYGVYLDHAYTTTALEVRDDTVYLSLGGFRYEQLLYDGGVIVGRSGGDRGYLTLSGGVLSAYSAYLGRDAGSYGSVDVEGGTFWEDLWTISVGYCGTGALTVRSGAKVDTLLFLKVGDEAGSTGTVVVEGLGARWTGSSVFVIGEEGNGSLTVRDGAQASGGAGLVAAGPTSLGNVLVEGVGSAWALERDLTVGNLASGGLTVRDGARVADRDALVGAEAGAGGQVVVQGAGSQWTCGSTLTLGEAGAGSLAVRDGGRVDSALGYLAPQPGSTGSADVRGPGSVWACAGALHVGGTDAPEGGQGGLASLTAGDGGTVTAGGLLKVWPGAALTVEAGGSVQAQHVLCEGTATVGAGTLRATEYLVNSGDLRLTSPSALVTAVQSSNSGVLSGTGRLTGDFANTYGGEVRVLGADVLVFTGAATNDGRLSLISGGTLDFRAGLTNGASGLIVGQGNLAVAGGLTNGGSLALSGGNSNVFGDVTNAPGGRVITSGGGTTTFWDDVVHNGAEIRTSTGCATVFMGSVSGSGPFTGPGTVYFEGDLQPGESPGAVSFGGDVVLGGTASLEIEIAGPEAGSGYDQVNVAGTATLGGTLDVVAPGPWRPAHNQAFTVMTFASRGGTLFDWYQGLDLGARLTLAATSGATDLVLTAVQGGSGEWGVDAGGSVSVASNWSGGLPNGIGDTATFGPVISAPREVTVQRPIVLGAMVFDSPVAYTIAGPGGVTLQAEEGHATVSVLETSGAADHVIATPLTLIGPLFIECLAEGDLALTGSLGDSIGSPIVKTGPGSLTFAGPLSFGLDALLSVYGGTVNLDSDAGRPGAANLSIDVVEGEVFFGADQHLDTLTIGEGGKVVFAGARAVVVKHLVIGGAEFGATTLTPEAATLGLLALGGLGMLVRRRRK